MKNFYLSALVVLLAGGVAALSIINAKAQTTPTPPPPTFCITPTPSASPWSFPTVVFHTPTPGPSMTPTLSTMTPTMTTTGTMTTTTTPTATGSGWRFEQFNHGGNDAGRTDIVREIISDTHARVTVPLYDGPGWVVKDGNDFLATYTLGGTVPDVTIYAVYSTEFSYYPNANPYNTTFTGLFVDNERVSTCGGTTCAWAGIKTRVFTTGGFQTGTYVGLSAGSQSGNFVYGTRNTLTVDYYLDALPVPTSTPTMTPPAMTPTPTPGTGPVCSGGTPPPIGCTGDACIEIPGPVLEGCQRLTNVMTIDFTWLNSPIQLIWPDFGGFETFQLPGAQLCLYSLDIGVTFMGWNAADILAVFGGLVLLAMISKEIRS